MSSMNSRDRILQSLRENRRPFEQVSPRPEKYLPVMPAVEGDLVTRFAAEMTKNGATVHVIPDAEAAIQQVLDLIGSEKRVLAWENLNLPGLAEALEAEQVKIVIPKTGGDQRQAATNETETIRIGVTGADAGIATTGTLALITQKGQGRIPALPPPTHIPLLAKDPLIPPLEDSVA